MNVEIGYAFLRRLPGSTIVTWFFEGTLIPDAAAAMALRFGTT